MNWLIDLVDITFTHLINFVIVPLSLDIYGVSLLTIISVMGVFVMFIWLFKLIRG